MLQRMGYGCMRVGIRVRAALTNAICRRSFSMASIAMDQASDAVSFVASDINKVRLSCSVLCVFRGEKGEGVFAWRRRRICFCSLFLPGSGALFFSPALACARFWGPRRARAGPTQLLRLLIIIGNSHTTTRRCPPPAPSTTQKKHSGALPPPPQKNIKNTDL